jgi:NADH-ubiquinone oxidoreductase chain 5
VVQRLLQWGHTITYKVLDRGLIEEIGPTGVVKIVGKMAEKGSEYQSGQISQYSLGIIIGTIVFIVYNSM